MGRRQVRPRAALDDLKGLDVALQAAEPREYRATSSFGWHGWDVHRVKPTDKSSGNARQRRRTVELLLPRGVNEALKVWKASSDPHQAPQASQGHVGAEC